LTLSSADTHGIAKYARTYIRDTHTRAHTHTKKKVERLEKEQGKKSRKTQKKKKMGSQERKEEEKKTGRKEKGGKEGGK